jgi:hypothetical protein
MAVSRRASEAKCQGPQGLKPPSLLALGGTAEAVPSRLWTGLGLFAAVKRVRENSVVPPGLELFLPLYPALKRWAKLGRPFGAGFLGRH